MNFGQLNKHLSAQGPTLAVGSYYFGLVNDLFLLYYLSGVLNPRLWGRLGMILCEWVVHLPLIAQGSLLFVLRGPDSPCSEIKNLTRWFRGLVLREECVTQESFVAEQHEINLEKMVGELNYLAFHYVLHLLRALVVIKSWHPDGQARTFANQVITTVSRDSGFLFQEELLNADSL